MRKITVKTKSRIGTELRHGYVFEEKVTSEGNPVYEVCFNLEDPLATVRVSVDNVIYVDTKPEAESVKESVNDPVKESVNDPVKGSNSNLIFGLTEYQIAMMQSKGTATKLK